MRGRTRLCGNFGPNHNKWLWPLRVVLQERHVQYRAVLLAICHLPEVDKMTFRVNDGTSERSVLHNCGRKRSKSVLSSKRPLNWTTSTTNQFVARRRMPARLLMTSLRVRTWIEKCSARCCDIWHGGGDCWTLRRWRWGHHGFSKCQVPAFRRDVCVNWPRHVMEI